MPCRKQAKIKVAKTEMLLVIIYLIKLLARTNLFNVILVLKMYNGTEIVLLSQKARLGVDLRLMQSIRTLFTDNMAR